jgi:uncharacterized membrane protein YqjE
MQNECRNLSDVVNEIKIEAKEFVSTRLQMFNMEMKEKLSAWKIGIPLLIGAAVCGLVAFIVLNYALIAFLAALFAPSQYNWCFAGLIVGFFYLIVAAALYWIGMREIKAETLTPTRTLRVLKQDQIWLQNEARSQA